MTASADLPPLAGATAARPYLSIVAPCYNEEQVLREFYRRVSAVARDATAAAVVRETAAGAPANYEIVLVDDGSRDRTWSLMEELAASDPHVVAVKLARNHGHQLALTAGLHVCRGERVLIIDADLQDPPELLPEMLRMMNSGADVVYGQRRQRSGETRFKLWTAAAFYRVLNRLSDTAIPKDTGDFRLISRRALDVLLSMPERHRFLRGMVTWIGFRQEPLLFDRQSRYAGETKWPARKMLRFAIDALIAFSMWPVKLATILAAVIGAAGVVLLLGGLIGLLVGSGAAGWLFVLGILSLLSAAQLVVLGILGEYLGRLYDQAKGRPLFIIETVKRAGAGNP